MFSAKILAAGVLASLLGVGITRVTYSMISGAPINAQDKGAKGDNVTPDTTALNRAIAAVPAAGGTILVPTGTYLTNSNVAFPVNSDVRLDGASFSGAGVVAFNGDMHELHHQMLTDTPATNHPGMVELLHNSTTSTSYALDIKNFADNPTTPTAGLGGAGAIAIHQYSDRGPAIVQVDNTRSQTALIIRNTHNEFFARGNGGSGHFLDFVGYTSAVPYAPNAGVGVDPLFLGQLEGGPPGNPLTFASKDVNTPWQFRSDTTAPSLKITQTNAGIGLQINTAGISTNALSISHSAASTAVNISGDVNTSGFFPMTVTGYSHGPKFTTAINSGPALTLTQTIAGGNQLFFMDNRGGGLSIRQSSDGANTVFSTTFDGAISTTSTKTKGTCTLNGGTPATCTATVISGASCVVSPQGTTAASAIPVAWNVVGTVATFTAANGATNVVGYHCFG